MPDDPSIPEHVERLLVASIESPERLDVLLFLRANKPKKYGAKAVAQALSLRTQGVEQALAILCGRGFLSVAIENDLLYAYEPVSPSINEVMNELADLVDKDRAGVVRVLDTAPAGSAVRAFANAFLIRKGGKRDG
jgi:hypothetical protein